MSFRSLRTVTRALPFHLDDKDQVNHLFARWHQHRTPEDRRTIDIWTYCYIYRYFLIKFTPSAQHTPLSVDQLVTTAFTDAQRHLEHVRQPHRYTSWVATICRNAFINHLRARRSTISMEQEPPALVVEASSAANPHDASVVMQTVVSAINALPGYLREITRMRLLENCSYEVLAERTGHATPTLRAYINKALTQLRGNPGLQALLGELYD